MNTITTATVTVAAASATLTATAVSNNDTVTIGDITYTFKTTLSTGPTVAYEVLIDGSAANALDNLKLAINGGAGIGTKYSTGTVAHTEVEATDNGATTQKIESIIAGRSGAGVTLSETGGSMSWSAAAMSGGSITIVANTDDVTFTQPAQQVTVGEFPTANPDWSRALRLTDAGVFCMRYGASSAAMLTTVWSQIAVAMESGLTWVPYISTDPAAASTTQGGSNVNLSVVATSELTPLTYQWQYYSTSWTNITGANASDIGGFEATNYTSATMTLDPGASAVTTSFRCVVSDSIGQSSNSAAAIVTITTP